MLDKYRITLEFMVTAHSVQEAVDKGNKLAEVLNGKDPSYKAYVPMIVKKPESDKKKNFREVSDE
jgi:hypothetical protein